MYLDTRKLLPVKVNFSQGLKRSQVRQLLDGRVHVQEG